jgi:mono/diheme cytochrome c family protein
MRAVSSVREGTTVDQTVSTVEYSQFSCQDINRLHEETSLNIILGKNRKPAVRIAILGVVLFAAACTLHFQVHAQQAASVWDGVYTEAQAGRGKAAYGKSCASCHGNALEGNNTNPPLTGDEFKGNWNGQTLDDLFEKVQTSMPGDNPGSLSRDQNADILAFVLKSNAFPAGAKDLPTDPAALQKIHFDATKGK